jgi:hypothetical protein
VGEPVIRLRQGFGGRGAGRAAFLSLSRALKRERGTHREAMGGEGTPSTGLARPSPSPRLRRGSSPSPASKRGRGKSQCGSAATLHKSPPPLRGRIKVGGPVHGSGSGGLICSAPAATPHPGPPPQGGRGKRAKRGRGINPAVSPAFAGNLQAASFRSLNFSVYTHRASLSSGFAYDAKGRGPR